MTIGRSIKLYLVDGSPTGILTAEIMNWTGHVLAAPRSRIPEFIRRPEMERTGIYFLTGPDPEHAGKSLVYIGESDNVGKRLTQHNKDESKEFWERATVITSKDQNITKAHAKYLESRLIAITREAERASVFNNTAPEPGFLPEADISDMEFFIEQIRLILPVLSLDFLRPRPVITNVQRNLKIDEVGAINTDDIPIFEIDDPKTNVVAHMIEIGGEYVVMAGSTARATENPNYDSKIRDSLIEGFALIPVADDETILRFDEDVSFSSPSAAAATILNRSSNGRTTWKVRGTTKSYADWQDERIKMASTVEAR